LFDGFVSASIRAAGFDESGWALLETPREIPAPGAGPRRPRRSIHVRLAGGCRLGHDLVQPRRDLGARLRPGPPPSSSAAGQVGYSGQKVSKGASMTSLLELDRLVFNQKAKLIELTNEYHIRDENGSDVGFVREEGQSKLKKLARLLSEVDKLLTHRLMVYEMDGERVLELTRPRKVFKSRLLVANGSGKAIGEIMQKNVFGKIRFDLNDASGRTVGQIRAENWRAWDFAIVDATENEVARITKKWGGLAKAVFTTADNYVVEIDPAVNGDLRLLVVASAAGIDTALKQDDRGLSVDDFV
jgi:uncharacterized protein YxjI